VDDPGKAWNCQFFRSITSDSAIFDPRLTLGMNTKKGRVVDASIAQVNNLKNAFLTLVLE
jgi:hypothetical protein